MSVTPGHTCIKASDINESLTRFSDQRRDELSSLYQYTYPGLGLVTRQFRASQKEFSIDYIQEIALRVSDLVENNPSLPELTWATNGLEAPLELARALLVCGFLLLKEGRSSRAHPPSDEQIDTLDDSTWYAIHPMYHAGLELDGMDKFSD